MDDICSGFAYWPPEYWHLFICNKQENEILGGLCKPMFLKNIAMKWKFLNIIIYFFMVEYFYK